MSNQLQENLNVILEEKKTKLLPENLKSGITCMGVTGNLQEGIDTSDATATASDITVDTSAYVNGEKVEGTLPRRMKGSVAETSGVEHQSSKGLVVLTVQNEARYASGAKVGTQEVNIANAIGLTSDKITTGNTVLGIVGTASAGVLSEEEYNNLLLLTDDILTNPNVGDNETIEMFKLYPTMGPITEFAVASEYAPYGGSILFEEENAVRLEIIMEDEFQGRFLVYNDKYEYQPVSDSYAGVTASGIQVTGGHIADIDTQYYYFELNGLHVEFETVSYHTFDNYLDIIDSVEIVSDGGTWPEDDEGELDWG